jgi:hypothetical protein
MNFQSNSEQISPLALIGQSENNCLRLAESLLREELRRHVLSALKSYFLLLLRSKNFFQRILMKILNLNFQNGTKRSRASESDAETRENEESGQKVRKKPSPFSI